MKLYFLPGACSLSPHIVLREAGMSFELEKVDRATKRTASGEDYLQVNPKGYVPALKLDDGQILTEGPAIVQYLADQKPESGLAPKTGTMERYRLMEWLNFTTSELHKQFSPLFNPKVTPDWKQNQLDLLAKRFDHVETNLKGKSFVMGDRFTVADAYLFTVLNWSNFQKIDLAKWPTIKDYLARIAARPSVKEALRAEGLAK
ncbi:MAG: glutathione transferase GstA [Sulfurifustaceae bacterium]